MNSPTQHSTSADLETNPPIPIDEDDECEICQSLLRSPVRTSCNHTFCNVCLAEWIELNITPYKYTVDVDFHASEAVTPQEFTSLRLNDRYWGYRELKCPKCRQLSVTIIDRLREAELRLRYQEQYVDAMAVDRQIWDQEREEGWVHILFGNLCKHWPGGTLFFVRFSRPEIVECMEVHEPVEAPVHATLRQPPFQVQKLGWDSGPSVVRAYVVFKRLILCPTTGDTITTDHVALDWVLNPHATKQSHMKVRLAPGV
ncbi:hypothetical protein M011DRAFT_499788 [Sporormia fimetaria CBS 119925]|uniref:RING-type domain-containing protein n=1 Tax=Sporormia fimetaria CBS 119925 TaxID=1340428 RepID=A0A6A6VB84_9PLEO|nr:hypothetical protein M011DRAFT_499788 [Sporormia fimetaria CBS 119925]